MKMKTTLSLVAASAVALFSYGAFAQDSTKSRAEVKEEAKAATKTAGSGEASPTATAKPKSTKARTDVKGETKSANKSGQIATGDASKGEKAKSTASRSDVKSETKSAVKAGQTTEGDAPAKK
jgi:hypothetical protein